MSAAYIKSMTYTEQDHPRDTSGQFSEKPRSAPEVTIRSFSHKEDDPRYVHGVSENDDDMSDEEWFETMGEPDNEVDDGGDMLFAVEHDGVGYDVVDSMGGYVAHGDDGSTVYFIMDHDSIDDALQDAIAERKADRLSAAIDNHTLVGRTGDIAGYTYQADNHKPSELVEVLIGQGKLAPGARGMDPDEALMQLAGVEGIDREDEYSFDSDEFPKVILVGQLSEHDLDWLER